RQASQVPTALDHCRQTAAACRRSLTKAFLVIAIEWDEPCDIDLHVTDPAGRKFSYEKKTFSGSDGQLSLDMTSGPGIEVWQNPSAEPGTYEIAYHVFAGLQSPGALVRGWVIDRSGGKRSLPEKILHQSEYSKVAKIRVERDGSIIVDPLTN